ARLSAGHAHRLSRQGPAFFPEAGMKFLYLVWSNLKRKKLRTSLTLLSIFVAFVLFGLLCTIKEAFTAGVSMAGADRLIVRHKVSLIMTMPVTYGPRIERIPGVAS